MTISIEPESKGLSHYFSQVRKHPVLDREEEIILTRRVASGCLASRDRLLLANLGLVITIAKTYRNMGLPFEDLINEGTIGLIEAARRFDPGRSAKFITYARWWVRKWILEALAHRGPMIRIPAEHQRRLRRVAEARRDLQDRLGRVPDSHEISLELAEDARSIQALLTLHRHRVGPDLREGEPDLPLDEWIADPHSTRFHDDLLRREATSAVERALATLSKQEWTVIACRYGIGDLPMLTLREIGELLGISRERVRQIEEQAKQRLKKALLRRGRPRPRALAVAAGS